MLVKRGKAATSYEAERFDQRQARAMVDEKLKATFACPLDLKLAVIVFNPMMILGSCLRQPYSWNFDQVLTNTEDVLDTSTETNVQHYKQIPEICILHP